MSIVIESVVGSSERGVRALVVRDGEKLEVDVACTAAAARAQLGRELIVEIGFLEVVTWREVDAADRPGLFAAGPERVRIVGAVHGVIEVAAGEPLFDVYIAEGGPEFVTFERSDLLGACPKVGDHVEVVVRGLCFYPTWT